MAERLTKITGIAWLSYAVVCIVIGAVSQCFNGFILITISISSICGGISYHVSIYPDSKYLSRAALPFIFAWVAFVTLIEVLLLSLEIPDYAVVDDMLVSISCLMAVASYVVISRTAAPVLLYQSVSHISRNNSFCSVTSLPKDLAAPLLTPEDFATPEELPGDSIPTIVLPSIISSSDELSGAELKMIEEIRAHIPAASPVSHWQLHDWFKLAWSRQLDPVAAVGVLGRHIECIAKFKLSDITMDTVKENFRAGFSVLAGRDISGRPILWQRMKYMTPASIPLNVGIKSTWLAIDAALADAASNRLGACLVYDFSSIGLANVTLNLIDVRDGCLACGISHPSHISRVVFLDAPMFFRLAFAAVAPLLPSSVTTVVEFADSSKGFDSICKHSDLPRYLREDRDLPTDVDDYMSWLISRLRGQHLLYESQII